MKTFIERSLSGDILPSCCSLSFLSFERAIRETNRMANIEREVAGYRVTERGIEIIWKD